MIQTFNIHTGSGSNSKSTKIVMMKSAIGEYFIEMNAETFTKPPRSANATSELHEAKGKLFIFFNEPEKDADNGKNHFFLENFSKCMLFSKVF